MGPTTVELGIATLARMRGGRAPTGTIVRCMLGEASQLAHTVGRFSFELRHSHAHGVDELPITPDVACRTDCRGRFGLVAAQNVWILRSGSVHVVEALLGSSH